MHSHCGTHTHTHTHTHAHTSQEVHSGKFEMYDYGSAEDNMKYYRVVCVGRVVESVCVGRVVESAGCVLGG